MKRVMIVLDSQKREFSSSLRPIYDFVKNFSRAINYNFFIMPLIKRLSKEKNIELRVVALDFRTAEFLKKKNIPFISRTDVTSAIFDIETGERAYAFVRYIPKIISRYDSSYLYKENSMMELDEKNIWRSFIFPAVKAIETFEDIIKKEKISKVIIIDRNNFYQKILKAVAEKNRIEISDEGRYVVDTYTKKTIIKLLGWSNMPRSIRDMEAHHIEVPRKIKKRILISHNLISHNKIVPWAKLLTEKYDVVYVGAHDFGGEYSKVGIRYRRIQDYATASMIDRIDLKERYFDESFESLQESTDFHNEFTYNKIPLWPIVEDMFLYMHYIGYPIIVSYIELIERMIEIEQPDLVITVDDRSRYGKTLVNVASLRGIPTLIVQHGAVLDHPLFSVSKASKIAVYGEHTKKILAKRGVRLNQIEITGQAEDIPTESPEVIIKEICKELGLKEEKPIIVFASQALPESMNIGTFHEIYSAFKKFPEVQFVVKLHPDEKESLHREMIKNIGLKNLVIIKDVLLKKLLVACNALINIYSTVGIEALYLGKPLISVNEGNTLPAEFFPRKSRGIFTATSCSEIESAISDILKNKYSEENIKKEGRFYISESGEAACRNVVRVVDELLRGALL